MSHCGHYFFFCWIAAKMHFSNISVNSYFLQTFEVVYIMVHVIDSSGVQFGLKSYMWFQNWMSVQREVDLKSQDSMISDQDCNDDLKFNCHFITSTLKSHNLLAKFAQQWLFCLSFSCNMWLIRLKKPWLIVLFYCPILIGWEKDAI